MFIAQQLRQKNIAEYLLYMWQVEDIIRAYNCSLSRIKEEYLSKFDYNEEQAEEEVDWYASLITMMNQEGKRLSGHLQINQVILLQLNELHQMLLQSPKFPFYNAAYYKTLPYIVELRNKGNKETDEIETCMNALYGILLLRLKGREITPDTTHAVQQISNFIGILNDYYLQDKKGELNFEDN